MRDYLNYCLTFISKLVCSSHFILHTIKVWNAPKRTTGQLQIPKEFKKCVLRPEKTVIVLWIKLIWLCNIFAHYFYYAIFLWIQIKFFISLVFPCFKLSYFNLCNKTFFLLSTKCIIYLIWSLNIWWNHKNN